MRIYMIIVKISISYLAIFGFRPKGIFTGTLVATSFIIYLTMIMRNNLSMLSGLFILAFLTNGRLALLISGTTLFFKIFKKYDLILLKQSSLISVNHFL